MFKTSHINHKFMTNPNISQYGFIFLAITLMVSCKPSYQEVNNGEDPLTRVYVKELATEAAPIPIHATGLISTVAEIRLSFKIGGIIDRMNVEEGQYVKPGQLLATLKLDEIQAQVAKATQAKDKALRDMERAQRLYQDTVVTLEQLQNATTAFEVAKSDLEIAQFNQRYARIIAPTSGKILRKFTEPSELVSPGIPIYALGGTGNKSAYKLEAGLADRDIVEVQMGDSASIHIDAYPDTSFAALVTEIAQAADPRTGVFGIELTLAPTSFELKNGFVGKASIFPSTQQPYYIIPMSALIEGNEREARVFVPGKDSAIAQSISVKPHYIGDDYFTVLQKDWKGGLEVITEGAAYLSEGSSFQIIATDSASKPSYTALTSE